MKKYKITERKKEIGRKRKERENKEKEEILPELIRLVSRIL